MYFVDEKLKKKRTKKLPAIFVSTAKEFYFKLMNSAPLLKRKKKTDNKNETAENNNKIGI